KGSWTSTLAHAPVTSIAHADGIAVAIAGDDVHCCGIGVDIERDREMDNGFETIAFGPHEQTLLSALKGSSRHEWPLRVWCAKEALAKALGQGLVGGPRSVKACQVDANTGVVTMALSGELTKRFPDLDGADLMAYTAREAGLIFAMSVHQRA